MKPTPHTTQGRLENFLEPDDFGTPSAELTAQALRVLESRYLHRDEDGRIVETPRQLFSRVARAVAAVENKWPRQGLRDPAEHFGREFFDLLVSLRFLPNSPTLMNAGRPHGQLSACFVLPLEDDLGKVFDSLRDSAVIHKTGGGTGFSFSHIRPSGARVRSSGGSASGPMAFLRIFDQVTQVVKQGGTRRGANMAILSIDHPEIEAFIESKRRGGIENFNISVGVSEAFMKAVKSGGVWELKNPVNGKTMKTVKARRLWNAIAKAAWTSGDPGVVFLDRVNEENPTPELGRMESTNPCGEVPLLPYESCNLGSINLLAYVRHKDFAWDELERDIRLAVRFLDDIIEANDYPLAEIDHITKMNRKIGLGVMGWADALMEWGVPYDSEEALRRADETMGRINRVAIRASEELAAERGAFPGFDGSLWARRGHKPRRNATVTTVAPTGTLSIIAGVSSGIEPAFSLAYERSALEGQRLVFVHPLLKRVLRERNIRSRRALGQILATGSVAAVREIPAAVKRVLKTAPEIRPLWHVRMQAVFQRHTENAVSKTINLPNRATVNDVRHVYEAAYDLGCKGITIFRDASKQTQILRAGLGGKGRRREDLLEAVDWLLDDTKLDSGSLRKRASVGLATLSRAQLKKKRTAH